MSASEQADGGAKGLSESKRKLLAQRLAGKGGAGKRPSEGMPKQVAGAPLGASMAQRWLYLSQESLPGSAAFNITSCFEVRGSVNLSLLERCVHQVVSRHQVLRSNFRFSQGELVVLERSAREQCLEHVVCATIAERDEEAARRARATFDLESDVLFHLHYLECSDAEDLLLLVVHHVVFDEWSLGVFWREVTALYREDSDCLSPLPIQYADFSAWQTEQFKSGQFDHQLDYWKRELADLPPPLPLPSDRPYPLQLTDAGRLGKLRLPEKAANDLKRFAVEEGAGVSMVVMLAFQLFLQRYTGTDDILVGTPVANRSRKELAELIGFFLSTVAIRSRFEGDPTVRDALAGVRETSLAALSHQDFPFDRLVEELKPPRHVGRHPVCQVMLVYQRENEMTPALVLDGVELNPVLVETHAAKFDLTLFAIETDTGMELMLEYRSDLFEPAKVERMLGHIGVLLEEIVARPHVRVSELEMLTSLERGQIFGAWQGESDALSEVPAVLSQVQTQIGRSPHSDAVVGSAGALTRGALNDLSENVAHQLQAFGVGPGDRVAHLMERTPEAIAGILGIMKSGAAYVPMDPGYPAERLEFIIRDASIAAAVTCPRYQSAPGLPEQLVVLSPSEPALSQNEAEWIDVPTNAAYLIYTSGSTGLPKGVVVSQANLLHSTEARERYYQDPPERFLLVPSLAFDSSIAGIFWTLAKGGILVLASSEEQRDPAKLGALVREQGVTDLLCVPTLYREMIRLGSSDLASLKRVIVAGEPCPPFLVSEHFKKIPAASLYNEYGPTEASVWATVHACQPEDGVGDAVSIGKPIANTTAYVLDHLQRPLPVGLPGELYLGGTGVAVGYHGRDELTGEKFLCWKQPDVESTRLYRTGDLVTWSEDGSLFFLGRADDQLKLNGYRIEPGEIEAELQGHPALAQAVVVPRTGAEGRVVLAAFFTVRSSQTVPEAPEFRAMLSKRLPSFMIPASFVPLEEFPVTPNGKVDRAALAKLVAKGDPKVAHVEPAQDQTEAQLMRIWDDLLDLPEVGRNDNFFDLGGHSLMLPVLFERLRQDFGVELPLGTAFAAPTIAEIAEVIRTRAQPPEWRSLVAIRESGSRPPLYLVHGLGGEVGFLYQLMHYLPSEQPLFGVRPPVEPFDDIIAMAAHYLKEIQKHQPRGPYRLGGYCIGGCVAFEMAQQLKAQGEEVELLALFDSMPPGTTAGSPSVLRLLSKSPRTLARAVKRRVVRALGPTPSPEDIKAERLLRQYPSIPKAFWKISATHIDALRAYRPQPFPGDLNLLRSKDERFDSDFGWGRFVQGTLTISSLQGPHSDVLKEPNLPVAAEKLNVLLDELDA